MNQQPDKLFREKLETFQLKVSPEAWNKLHANLDKKNNGPFWLKVAASLLIVAVCGGLIWSRLMVEKPAQPLATATTEKSNVKNQAAALPKEKVEQAPVSHPGSPASENKRQNTPVRKKRKVQQPIVPIKEAMASNDIVSSNSPSAERENNTITESVSEKTTIASGEIKNNSRLTIVITAEEVDEKYLDKKSLAEATSVEKKSSTLRKLLDTAYDLKYNQDPFGDLRQRKNEILALNFKNEKQRNQNK